MIDYSVILPVANEENSIADTLNSIINQELDKSSEIIISINNSIDSTYNISKLYSEKYPTIKIVNAEICSGKNEAINNARRVAEGKYHFVCDGDISLKKDIFSKLYKILENENYIAVGATPYPTDSNGEIAQLLSTPLHNSIALHGRLYAYDSKKVNDIFKSKSIDGFPLTDSIADDIWFSLMLGRKNIFVDKNSLVYFHPYPIKDRLKMAIRNSSFYIALKKEYPDEVNKYDRSISDSQKKENINNFIRSNGIKKYAKLKIAKTLQKCVYSLGYLIALTTQTTGWDTSSDSKKGFQNKNTDF